MLNVCYSKHWLKCTRGQLCCWYEKRIRNIPEWEEFEDWVEGAESLVDLSEKHSEEWLSYYWASYMYTQIARASRRNPPDGITAEGMVDKAQKYLDLAKQRIKDFTTEQEVDFHMLQQLIYSFRTSPDNDKNKFENLAKIEAKKSFGERCKPSTSTSISWS